MARAKSKPRRARRPSAATGRRLTIEVVWGDITQAEGDLFVVGHYQGVLPQAAERALDVALSGTKDDRRLVLTDLTRRGAVRGALGDIAFFPWGRQKTVVLAGMGRPGTFRAEQLRRLTKGLVFTVGRLVEQPTVCAVLIGSGTGTLSIAEAVSGTISGLMEALESSPHLSLGRIRIVELSLDRALETLSCFKAEARGLTAIRVEPRLTEGSGGIIPDAFGYSMLLAAVARESGLAEQSGTRHAIEDLIDKLPSSEFRSRIKQGLAHAARRWRDLRTLALQFPMAPKKPKPTEQRIAMRMSFCVDDNAVSSSAITNTVTVAERKLGASAATIQRALQRLQAPEPDQAAAFGRGLARRLIHSEFTSYFDETGPLVIEVDRPLANVQWEMLVGGTASAEPIGVTRALARQLRTSYSPRPADLAQRQTWRALVIGDPGDPAEGLSLPDAREEAVTVAALLKKRGVAVTLLVGAPGAGGKRPEDARAADLLEVVDLLSEGLVDLVHYCGHAVWNPSFPDRTGWLFGNSETLTAGDLEGMERPPLLVVANACFSAGLSEKKQQALGVPAASRAGGDAGLVAGLADEFFKRGIADYIGTAWAVPSRPATLFARVFYGALLPSSDSGRRAGKPIGEAVRLARLELYNRRAKYGKEHGSVWGAYQHYGDPTRALDLGS